MHLLYLTTSFHALTMTFVAREVDELRRLGTRVSLLALRRPQPGGAAQPECDVSGCMYVFPLSVPAVAVGLLKTAFKRPRAFARALSMAVTSPGDPLRVRLKLVGQLFAATASVAAVDRLGVDGIHAHLASPPGSYALFLSILTGIPFSFTGHAADLYRRPEGLRLKLREAKVAVAISEYNRKHYRRLVDGGASTPVVHCGIRLGDFPFRQRHGVGRPLRVLAVGRAAEKKGFVYLLEALAILNTRNVAWTGDLVGGGPLLGELRQKARDLGLESLEVSGSRQQEEIRRLLAQADVFVLPCVEAVDGDIDGIPVALMEAMASGCPVISSRLSGIPELITDDRSGLLAEPGNPDSLAMALMRLIEEPELAERLSTAGRDAVERSFNLEVEVRKLDAVFRQSLTTRARETTATRDV